MDQALVIAAEREEAWKMIVERSNNPSGAYIQAMSVKALAVAQRSAAGEGEVVEIRLIEKLHFLEKITGNLELAARQAQLVGARMQPSST